MGITEYVASRHTFGILICVIHDGIDVDALTFARRLHAAAPTLFGLYAYATATATTVVTDTLLARISPQYKMVLYVNTSSGGFLQVSGPSALTTAIQTAFAPAAVVVVTPPDHNLHITVGPDATTRPQTVEKLSGILSRLTYTAGR